MEMRKTEAIAEAVSKKQEASPDLLLNPTGSSHYSTFEDRFFAKPIREFFVRTLSLSRGQCASKCKGTSL